MANPKLITFYISQVVLPIRDRLNKDIPQAGFTKEDVDKMLKLNAEIDISKIQMSNEDLNGLILSSFMVGDNIGLDLQYPLDYIDKLIDLNIK